jgi:hypothetical protein
MSRFLSLVGLTTVIFLFPAAAPVAAQPPAKAEEELVEKVRKSIDQAVNYLKSEQNKRGTWEDVLVGVFADLEGGQTALVTLALLNAGVKPEDPTLEKALEFLRKLEPKKTYVVALQNMAFAEARQAKDLPLIKRNADWLISRAIGYRNGAGRLELPRQRHRGQLQHAVRAARPLRREAGRGAH